MPPPPATPGFNFTAHMRLVCGDVVARLAEFSHVDLDRVLVTFSQARNRTRFGIHAGLTPLRFAGGACETVRRGKRFRAQTVRNASGREVLYILSFYLPRFLDEGLEEKIATVVHELWHIGPLFDGDLRRHAGRCYAHSRSKSRYDAHMHQLAARYLAQMPGEGLLAPLRLNFDALRALHGRIQGTRVARPRLVPVE